MNIKNINKNHLTLQDFIFDIWQDTEKETQLKLSGHSMTPVIKNGDWLIIKHNSNYIRIGSIIAYRSKGKIIVHRVIKIQNQSFITKGDFNLHLDDAVDIKSVIGKVIAVKNRKRLYRLDTKFSYLVGYIIATIPFIYTRSYRRIHYFKNKLLRL